VSIQIVSASNASQAVTLVYVVGNQSTFLNGTVASSLLSQLSAELVGFYLTYPPLTIAERKFIHAMHRGPVVSPETCTMPGHVLHLLSKTQLKNAINGGWN
jgi:hypothetical protein